MVLCLMRHGEALKETEDPRRGLSRRGMNTVQTVAMDFSLMNPDVRRILHSGKLRSRQTAEVLAELLKAPELLQEDADLAPGADPSLIEAKLEGLGTGTVLVGHLPHLSRLISLLLTGNPELELVHLRPGGIVCLEGHSRPPGQRSWRIEWMVRPVQVEMF